MTRARSRRFAARVAVACAIAVVATSCGRDAPTPVEGGISLARQGRFTMEPVFPRLVGGRSLTDVVAFEKVRVLLHRADGSVALDTVVMFPVGADSVVLAASVPLSAGTGNGGENFKLDLGYMNAAGEVVFKGGPVDLTVVPKGSNQTPPPVQIPISYSGPGSTASKVTISPRSQAVTEGGPFSFAAQATDASGAVLSNTPIVWATLDPTRLSLPSPGSGSGVALGLRGEGRVVAQLLTGQADTVIVSVSLLPRGVALASGDAQKGIVSTALAQPIAVKVTASDGVGAPGVNVTFAVTTGGGSVASASVVTDANGIASTGWTLGAAVGEQRATASASGLAGSPVTFRATARSVAPVKLSVVTTPPASSTAGSVLPLTVHVLDAQGDVAKTFSGPVSVTLGGGPAGVPLLGSTSVNAVAGVATFTDLRINRVGTGYVLTASANGLQSAASTPFAIVPGPAQRLEFNSYPVFGAQAGTLEAITVVARDAVGNLATGFAGTVTLSTLVAPSGAVLGGSTKVSAVAGQATFGNITLTLAGSYQLAATADDIVAAKGPEFSVTAGPPSRVIIIAGSGQVGSPGGSLAKQVVAGLADLYGNRAVSSGVSLSFTASDGGSASPASGVTNSGGQLATSWTLGGATGTQSLTVSSAGLASAVATATATGVASLSGAGDVIVLDDVNAFDDGYGFTMSGASYVYGNPQFVRNVFTFSISGARAAANQVLLINDRGNLDYTLTGYNWTRFAALITSLGLTIAPQSTSHAVLTAVPSDVKVVIIHTPATYFSTAEINGLKAFAAEGGRILVVGENMYYYSYQAVETALLRGLGSSITVVPACAAWGEIVRSVSHPLTTGVPLTGAGGFYQACSSYHTGHGSNDTPLMYDSGNNVVATLIKVNTTPLLPSAVAAMRAPKALQETVGRAPRLVNTPVGADLTTGPARHP